MPRVLIVDDSEDMQDALGDSLSLEGFEVTSALDGKRGLELLREVKPDVILLDMMMPEMDGLQVLSCLSAEPSPPPVVAHSGFDGFRDEALRRGAHAFLLKPMSIETLLAALRSATEHRPLEPSVVAENTAAVEKARRDAAEQTRIAVKHVDDGFTQELREGLRRVVRWLPAYFGFGKGVVTILRGSELWIEAIHPGSGELHEGTHFGVELAYCDDVITAGSTLLLCDPDHHPCERFAHHPKADPAWRFYAGVPLTTPSGAVLGTLCVVDSTPHEFHTEDMRVLEALGLAVARGLESRAWPLDADGAFGREFLDLFVEAVAARASRRGGAGVIMTVDAVTPPPEAAGLALVRLDRRVALLWGGSVGAWAPSQVIAAHALAKIELQEERDREQACLRMRSICA
jgi:CheY-like chemotaxis protein